MQHVKIVLLLATITTVLPACNKYLNIQPEDRMLEGTVYKDVKSVRSALNGIYLNLAKPGLYGENFSSTTLDVMAQYYDVIRRYYHPFEQVMTYDYGDSNVRKYVADMWNNSYTAILNLNIFIEKLETDSSVLARDEKQLLLGEAYGLRSFIGFDLLRTFGPVFKTDSTATSIPYPTVPGPDVQPLLPANRVISLVLADLSRAATLLENDPVRAKGVQAAMAGEDIFFSLRNRRMNYFAVHALTARVFLYQGNTTGARAVAAAVITEAGSLFPWSPSTSSAAGIPNPDRIFSSEVIFGLENINLYVTQQNWFAAFNTDRKILKPSKTIDDIYDRNPNDYRYRSWFAVDPSANRIIKTFQKYADVRNPDMPFRQLQPAIRISEMYYIAAECAPDDNSAATLLNTVRANRGLPPLTVNGDRENHLAKEYQKEFWGEGQLFFYYKRKNQSSIANPDGNGSTAMTAAKYAVPLPLSETSLR